MTAAAKSASRNPVTQHDIEIQRNREAWRRKPMLREIYHEFYHQIAKEIDPCIPGPIVELGSGMGRIKDIIPSCITTDIFPNPWLDRQENCYQLSFSDSSISHLILFDVWHHLRYPGAALREFQRVLSPGGRIILFEPAISWLGGVIYHRFHHEPVAMRDTITWDAPENFSAADTDYYAAQGSATRIFWRCEAPCKLRHWRLLKVCPIPTFDYFASGGFSGPELGGALLHKFMRGLNYITSPFPRVFAGRLLVVLEKERIQ